MAQPWSSLGRHPGRGAGVEGEGSRLVAFGQFGRSRLDHPRQRGRDSPS